MVDVLRFNDDPIAVPAFRIIAIIAGDIHAPENVSAIRNIYSLFEENFGELANVTSYNFPGHTGKIRWANPKLLDQARAWFERDATEYGQGIRRYGYEVQEFEEPALPYFGVEQRSYFNFLEIDIRHDDDRVVAFANSVTEHLLGIEVICGVMGMGFFLPPYKSSLVFELGRMVDRYRPSIEISPSMIMNGIRREGSSHRWKEGEEPGIADIGWRTLIGREFWSRIPDAASALKAEKDIAVEQSDKLLAVTAGTQPVWGDTERNEDISAYRAIARHLVPILYPKGAAMAFMFGGGTYDADVAGRIDAYLKRFS